MHSWKLVTHRNPDFLFYRANLELQKAAEWFSANLLTLNAKKTSTFCSKKKKYIYLHFGKLNIGGEEIERIGENGKETSFKFLGHQSTWYHHSNHVYKKLISANFSLSRSKGFLPTYVLKSIYQSLFESHLHFGSIVWGSAKSNILSKLEIQQKKAIRHVNNLKYNAHTKEAFKQHGFLQLFDLILYNQAVFIQNYKNNKLETYPKGRQICLFKIR